MHRNDIKNIVRKQIKTKLPNWKRLTKNEKKEIAQKTLDVVKETYDIDKTIKSSVSSPSFYSLY